MHGLRNADFWTKECFILLGAGSAMTACLMWKYIIALMSITSPRIIIAGLFVAIIPAIYVAKRAVISRGKPLRLVIFWMAIIWSIYIIFPQIFDFPIP